jgi:Domain of unknown function (DUF4440)
VSDVRAAFDEWTSAIVQSDRQAAERILDDDYVLSSSGGVGDTRRAEWLETLEKIETTSLEPLDLRELVLGDVAVVSGRWRWNATLGERNLTGDYAITDILIRRGGRWRPRWRISTKVSS